MRRGREGVRDRWGREGGRESEAGWEGGREGREGGREREREREREAGTTWLPHRSTLSRLPRGLSALSTSAARLFSGKKKFRLLSGHLKKFRLLYEKIKVETHIWTF